MVYNIILRYSSTSSTLEQFSRGKLSNLHVKGALRYLKKEFWEVSPAFGLLHSAAPSLLANTCQIKSLSHDVAKDLYYQRSHHGKRYGPVAIANSKSLPIKWLNTTQIGHIVGLAVAQHQRQVIFDDQYLDSQLKKKNILCNYVQDVWTGISFARYRKMIHQITHCIREHEELRREYLSKHEFGDDFIPPNYGLLVLVQCVWEKSSNKEDIWKYYEAIEHAAETSIFLDGKFDREAWIQEQFAPSDIDRLLEPSWHKVTSNQSFDNGSELGNLAEAIEVLAASLSVQAAFKGAIRQGRYSYCLSSTTQNILSQNNIKSFNIPSRPDCVEVVIREIIDNLVYDTSIGRLDINLLPSTTNPLLRRYYEQYLAGELTDIPNIASTTSIPSISQHYSEGQNSSAGAAWFQLCSNLPYCDYLCHVEVSKTAETMVHVNTKKPISSSLLAPMESFELSPTLKNVCRTLQQLLAPHTTIKKEWTRLEDVASYWNSHIDSISVTTNGRYQGNKITIQESRSMFRAPLSDTEMIYRDIGTIHVVNSPFLMQAELEPAHQLAAVKFVRTKQQQQGSKSSPSHSSVEPKIEDASEGLWQQSQPLFDRLYLKPSNQSIKTDKNELSMLVKDANQSGIQFMEIRSLLQGILFPNILNQVHDVKMKVPEGQEHLIRYKSQFYQYRHYLLTAKWGEEKWKPSVVTSMGDITITQSTMSLSLASHAQSQYTALMHKGLEALLTLYQLVGKLSEYDTGNTASENKIDTVENNVHLKPPASMKSSTKSKAKSKNKLSTDHVSRAEHMRSKRSWSEQWLEIAAWWLTDHHTELTTTDLQYFLGELLSFYSSSLVLTSDCQMRLFLDTIFIPFLLQYRMSNAISSNNISNDAGFLLLVLAMSSAKSITLKEQIFRVEWSLQDSVLAANPKIVLYKSAGSKSPSSEPLTLSAPLTVAQRLHLLRLWYNS